MPSTHHLTAVIEREGSGYVALCPGLDIASQGDTVEESQRNLKEAVQLFFETASQSEVQERLHSEVYVTHIEVAVGVNIELPRAESSGSFPHSMVSWRSPARQPHSHAAAISVHYRHCACAQPPRAAPGQPPVDDSSVETVAVSVRG